VIAIGSATTAFNASLAAKWQVNIEVTHAGVRFPGDDSDKISSAATEAFRNQNPVDPPAYSSNLEI